MINVSELFNRAIQHHQAGNFGQAEPLYQQILQAFPDHADSLHLLGALCHQTGRNDQAVAMIQRAIDLSPYAAVYHSNLGVTHLAMGRLETAAANFERALQLQPGYADAHCNLGDVLRSLGRFEEALWHCREAIRLQPNSAAAHGNLGNALLSLQRTDEGIAHFQQALRLNPNMAVVHNSLGSALEQHNKFEEASRCYQRAIQLDPRYAMAHSNLGMLYQRHVMFEEAIACYRRVLDLEPTNAKALSGHVHQLQHVCLWHGLEDSSRRLIESVEKAGPIPGASAIPPYTLLSLAVPTTPQQQLKCAQLRAQELMNYAAVAGKGQSFPRPPRSGAKITVGYMSSDFRVHAIAFLVAELLEKHERGQFAIHGYSLGPDDGSAIRTRIAKACERFVDLQELSNLDAAKLIAADGVDILVDLNGYTLLGRAQILALRAAPIQVNYLGYGGTMGAPFMDYVLVDDFVVPAEHQPYYTEKLVHLPGCYQVNDSQRIIAPETPTRADCHLPAEGFVFCSFNNTYKITPAVFDVWMTILKALPGSVLWLLESNHFAPDNLRREAEARGVSGERLVFAPNVPLPKHLARHRLAGLFLDTNPVNALTTASDALWAGCPLLTMAGETFLSRGAGSMLRALGLPELITTNLDEYRDLALRLARKPMLLSSFRERLVANRLTSRLFDASRFARSLEKAYAEMYKIHASGKQPRPIVIKDE